MFQHEHELVENYFCPSVNTPRTTIDLASLLPSPFPPPPRRFCIVINSIRPPPPPNRLTNADERSTGCLKSNTLYHIANTRQLIFSQTAGVAIRYNSGAETSCAPFQIARQASRPRVSCDQWGKGFLHSRQQSTSLKVRAKLCLCICLAREKQRQADNSRNPGSALQF